MVTIFGYKNYLSLRFREEGRETAEEEFYPPASLDCTDVRYYPEASGQIWEKTVGAAGRRICRREIFLATKERIERKGTGGVWEFGVRR